MSICKGQVLALGWILATLVGVCGLPAFAQAPDSEASAQPAVSSPANPIDSGTFAVDERTPTIREHTRKTNKIDGLFPLYRYPRTGKVLMEIRVDQIGKDYLYFAQSVDGPLSAGHFRGAHRAAKIVRLQRQFDRIEFVVQNTEFYFDPDLAVSKAAGANIAPAILTSAEIVAASRDGKTVVIDATRVFLSEDMHQIKPTFDPYEIRGERFVLGNLSPHKTRYRTIRNYPSNTDIQVAYTYDNPAPLNAGGPDVTDPRSVTIILQHSFIALKPNGYTPRRDDWRVGYFSERITDMTSPSFTPYRDVINRWHLVKKDPGAELSEPVTPITFWLENTTPEKWRPIIKAAVLSWNKAFEKAGFKNAIAVEIQPDDASWHAGDIRYNTIRWTASPNPAFGGIGPRLADPRTGEIIASDIMLEFGFISNRIRRQEIFDQAALEGLLAVDISGSEPVLNHDTYQCDFAERLQHQVMLGAIAQIAATGDIPGADADRLVEEGLRKLVMHEVGHALGLTHNMKASFARTLAEISDPAIAADKGLTASIMDYPAINLARPGASQGPYYPTKPGPYDEWAIEFGYHPPLGDPAAEKTRLDALLARSTEPDLAFGNDADDMRIPGRGIDPRVMVNDLSSEPIAWAHARFEIVDNLLTTLKDQMATPGDSWHAVRSSYLILTGEQARAANAVSRQIGGIYVERGNVGQSGAKLPFQPVPAAQQRAAMAFLETRIFAPDALQIAPELATYLQAQRRAFNFRRTTEDPKLHARALSIQISILNHLLHKRTLQRLTDSGAYGNTYSANAMLTDLTAAIFDSDADGDVNAYRQNLQTVYVQKLIRILKPRKPKQKNKKPIVYDPVSRAAATAQLTRINSLAAPPFLGLTGRAPETLAHRAYLRQLIAGEIIPEE